MTEEKHPSVILSLANRFLDFLERRSQSKSWPLVVFFVSILISLFSWVPCYSEVSEFIKSPSGEGKAWWLDHPFNAVPVEQFFPLSERHIGFNAGCASHLDKLTFRAFLPLVNQIAPFGVWTIVAACHVGALVILWLAYKLISLQSRDRVSGALVSWAVAASFTGQWGFHDYLVGDSVAVSLLLAAMFSRNTFIMFLLILAAAFTDERAVASAPVVLLYHVLREMGVAHLNLSKFFPAICKTYPIVAAVCTYIFIRFALMKYFGLSTGSSGVASIDILRHRLYSDFPGNYFRVFEFLWFIPALVLIEWSGTSKLERIRLLVFVAFLALAAFPSMVVWDLDRSLFYMLPSILLTICFWPLSKSSLRISLLGISLCNLFWLYPTTSAARYMDQLFSSFIVLKK